MRIRFLGTHQGESKQARFVSLLIDDAIAIDAGGLAGGLSFGEQRALQAVLITHYHLDHIKDLPVVGFNRLNVGAPTLPVYATSEVQDALLKYVMNGVTWLDLTQRPTPEGPALRFVTVRDGHPFVVGEYRITPIASRHPVPTVGYQISSPQGRNVYYTSDTGPDGDAWDRVNPDLLITEVTLSNDLEEVAIRVGHLTASLLHAELVRFRTLHGYLPRVRVIHVNPFQEEGIREEVAIVGQELGADIIVVAEGDEIEV